MEKTEKYTRGFEHYYYIYRCPGLSNLCKLGLSNRLNGSFATATQLELNLFWPSPLGELVWHLSTNVNNGLLAAYITVFYPRRDKHRCFIPCLVYALIYPSIASNPVTLATLLTRYGSVCTHTCSLLSRKPLLR